MSKAILIVGAGIAGVSVAFRLAERGLNFRIIDTGVNHSSRIAAGLINPVVFRRMALSWRIEELLPECKKFYEEMELLLGTNYLHPIPIRRAFAHQQEVDNWLDFQQKKEYKAYLKPLDEADKAYSGIHNTFGTGMVTDSYYVATNNFLDAIHEFWETQGILFREKMDYNQLDPLALTYKDTSYIKIIFCEGYHVLQNPWFSYLPLQATKGEILTIRSDEITETESLNRKCFVLPIGEQEFKVGATYVWNSPDVELTEAAKEELTGHIKQLTPAAFTVVNHQAGVRPTLLDRRPLLGKHPEFEGLTIFNGLGAKGYLIAPLLSKEFVAFLYDGVELNKEVDIKRYALM